MISHTRRRGIRCSDVTEQAQGCYISCRRPKVPNQHPLGVAGVIRNKSATMADSVGVASRGPGWEEEQGRGSHSSGLLGG